MTTTQPNDTNVLSNPNLTANLLHKAYGSSISVSVEVLAQAVFFKAFNTLDNISAQLPDHIRQNLKAYAFNLSEDAIDIEDDDESDFFDAFIDNINTFKSTTKDSETTVQMKEYTKVVHTLRKAGRILTVG